MQVKGGETILAETGLVQLVLRRRLQLVQTGVPAA